MRYWRIISPGSAFEGMIVSSSHVWPDGSISVIMNNVSLAFKADEVTEVTDVNQS